MFLFILPAHTGGDLRSEVCGGSDFVRSFSEQLCLCCHSFSPDSCMSKFLLFASSVVLCTFHVREVHSGFLHLCSFSAANLLCT